MATRRTPLGQDGGAGGPGAGRALARLLLPHPSRRWLGMFVVFRLLATAVAVALLLVQRVTPHDSLLLVVVTAYAAASAGLLLHRPSLTGSRVLWTVDLGTLFVLFLISADWRSPFYLLLLTALVLPASALGRRGLAALGAGATVAFAVSAHIIGPDPLELGTQASVESLAIHLLLPGLVCLGTGYAAEVLRHLESARAGTQRLAIEAERRRIAWELHDSAKQRIHAAHLLLSSLGDQEDERVRTLVTLATGELRAASADMDTSLAELRSPLEGRPPGQALRERVGQLAAAGGPDIEVVGEIAGLSPLQTAHAYRVAAEAVTNAIRHAEAGRVLVCLGARDGAATVTVTDDGRGMPEVRRPGATGLLAMTNRARTISGRLSITPGPDDRGTRVELSFPLDANEEHQA